MGIDPKLPMGMSLHAFLPLDLPSDTGFSFDMLQLLSVLCES